MNAMNARPALGAAASAGNADTMSRAFVRNWWLIGLRGLVGALFGLVAIFFPGPTLLSLVLLFSVYMLVDGIFLLASAFRAWREHSRWILLLVQGIASAVTGIVAFIWPGITILAFEILIASWSIVTGSLLLRASWRIDENHGRWWLALAGISAMLLGVLLIVAPVEGALALTLWLGIFALVFGISQLVLAFQLRSREHEHPPAATRPAT